MSFWCPPPHPSPILIKTVFKNQKNIEFRFLDLGLSLLLLQLLLLQSKKPSNGLLLLLFWNNAICLRFSFWLVPRRTFRRYVVTVYYTILKYDLLSEKSNQTKKKCENLGAWLGPNVLRRGVFPMTNMGAYGPLMCPWWAET